jgi:hypothetical protein
MSSLQVILLIFVGTIICNALGVLYQRMFMQAEHLKATTISVVMAGISLLIWRGCLQEADLTHSIPAIVSYLIGDAIGTYAGFKVPIDKHEHMKK